MFEYLGQIKNDFVILQDTVTNEIEAYKLKDNFIKNMYWFIKTGVIHGELVDVQKPNSYNLVPYDLKDKYIKIRQELDKIFEQACKKQAVNKLLGNIL